MVQCYYHSASWKWWKQGFLLIIFHVSACVPTVCWYRCKCKVSAVTGSRTRCRRRKGENYMDCGTREEGRGRLNSLECSRQTTTTTLPDDAILRGILSKLFMDAQGLPWKCNAPRLAAQTELYPFWKLILANQNKISENSRLCIRPLKV